MSDWPTDPFDGGKQMTIHSDSYNDWGICLVQNYLNM